MKIGICDAILALNPNAVVSCSGEDVNRIEWLSNTPVIAKNIILAKQVELQAQEDNKIAAKAAAEQSAINKLKALGLTDAEVKAFRG